MEQFDPSRLTGPGELRLVRDLCIGRETSILRLLPTRGHVTIEAKLGKATFVTRMAEEEFGALVDALRRPADPSPTTERTESPLIFTMINDHEVSFALPLAGGSLEGTYGFEVILPLVLRVRAEHHAATSRPVPAPSVVPGLLGFAVGAGMLAASLLTHTHHAGGPTPGDGLRVLLGLAGAVVALLSVLLVVYRLVGRR